MTGMRTVLMTLCLTGIGATLGAQEMDTVRVGSSALEGP